MRYEMQTESFDVLIIGGGGAGLRAAIAAASAATEQDLRIGLVSKVYPMRSHTVAAEGGAAAVTAADDSLAAHFQDTVSGGEWLCDQTVVDYFVRHAYQELVQMEHWGCPWSRTSDGRVAVRRFGGMKTPRTWYAADKTGFHMLHTLYHTALKYDQVEQFSEYFLLDLAVINHEVQGAYLLHVPTGELWLFRAKSVVLATGGAGRLFRFNTNGGIVTGDGMAIAYRHGVALRDMEFVQYHPTGLPGSGILITEACRGEGGVLLNGEGYRYLQDYGLGPATPPGRPQTKTMELGPRDRLSQAFWHEQQAGRTGEYRGSDVVYLDLRHLGETRINERLPFIRELAQNYIDIDPVRELIPVRPAVHYTMGGIAVDERCETAVTGLFAAGECASVGLHGANRLGSNSLSELLVFGALAGQQAVQRAHQMQPVAASALAEQSAYWQQQLQRLTEPAAEQQTAPLSWQEIRRELVELMETHCGIFRDEPGLTTALERIRVLQQYYQQVQVQEQSQVYNTELLECLETGFGLDVAEATCLAALHRRESRGAHQRLEPELHKRNDQAFLQHSLVLYQPGGPAELAWQAVNTTLLAPGESALSSPRWEEQADER